MDDARITQQADPRALALWDLLAQDQVPYDQKAVLAELQEIFRSDFPSFCALCLRVKPKGGGGTTPFLFNQVQRRIWREICDRINNRLEVFFVILKFRQAGMSTFWCAWLFWQMWRQRDIQCMVIAHQMSTAETMIETQKVFYDEMPEVFRPLLRDGNHGSTVPRGEIYFADRRSWELIHLSKNVDPRGQQVTHVLETEFSSFHDPDELNGALLPQLPPFGSEARLRASFIIESTPKGQNEFYDLYKDARDGDLPGYKAIFVPWFLFDEQYAAELPPGGIRLTPDERAERKRLSKLRAAYPVEDGGGKPVTMEQMYWRRATIKNDYRGDVDRFDQEYPSDDVSCWMLASKSVFREYTRELQSMVDNATDRATQAWAAVAGVKIERPGPVFVKLKPTLEERGRAWTPITKVGFEVNPHGKWTVWAPPVDGHKYIVGADPAMGLEDGDSSCICVIDVTTATQVAEFCDKMGPENFALEIAAAGYWYNQALVIPEINSIGFVVLSRLIANITYPNMYRWPKWDEVNRYSHKRGWETNHRTKQLLVSSMMHYVEEGLIQISSRELLGEMSTFEQRAQADYVEFGAQKGRHDDRVMAFGLCLMGILQTPLLSSEILRGASQLPNARELHLASGGDAPATPIPKALQEHLSIKHTIPWNPIQSEFFA